MHNLTFSPADNSSQYHPEAYVSTHKTLHTQNQNSFWTSTFTTDVLMHITVFAG